MEIKLFLKDFIINNNAELNTKYPLLLSSNSNIQTDKLALSLCLLIN